MTSEAGPVSFANAVLFGGANLDIKCNALVRATAGTSNPGRITTTAGGVARNIAHNLAMLGIRTRLVSVVGADEAGERVLRDSLAAGVDISSVLRSNFPTGHYVTVVDDTGKLIISVSDTEAITELTPARIKELGSLIGHADIVVADTNLAPKSLQQLAEIAAANSIPIAIDPVSVAKASRLAGLLGHRVPIFLLHSKSQRIGRHRRTSHY